MRGFGGNKVLGLAVGERSVLACELSRAGAGAAAGARAERMAEFVYPANVSPDDPAAFGPALREFLKAQRFGARRTVVGLPLKWAVVKTKEVPPVSAAALSDLLRLQAERDFAMEPQDLAVEYLGEANPAAPGSVLLIAVPRKRLDAVVAAAEAAGLDVEAATLSAAALGAETGRFTGGDGAVLHVAGGTAELAVQHQGQSRVLRHLRSPVAAGVQAPAGGAGEGGAGGAPDETEETPGAAALTVELRQVLSLMPQNGTAGHLNLWDGVGLGDAPRRWGDALGVVVREHPLSALGVDPGNGDAGAAAGSAGSAGSGRFAPAAALALAGLRGGPVVPDLLHSRLVVRKKSRLAKPVVWGAVLGVTLVVAIVAAWLDLAGQRRDVAEMQARLKTYQPDLKAAEASIARISFAQRWNDKEPKFVGVLRDLTAVFPGDGQVWATSANVQEDGRVTLNGRATTSQAAEAALDRLRATGKFSDLKILGMNPAGRNSGDVVFSVNFRAAGLAPPGPATRPAGAARGKAPAAVERNPRR